MKKTILILALIISAATAMAKEIKTVVFTTTPVMTCEKCENKIKGNLRFEKGVKDITTSVPDQEVAITFDADKTSETKLAEAFGKIGYTVKVKESCQKGSSATCTPAKATCDKTTGTCTGGKEACDKDKEACATKNATCTGAGKTCEKSGKTCAKKAGECCGSKKACK